MFKKTLIAAALAVAATGSFAQVYVEGAIGQGKVNVTYLGATSEKQTSSGNKFAIGYEINKDWSAELQMLNYGKSTASNGTQSAESKVTGTGIGAYWNTGSDKWGFKFGLSFVSTKNAETQTGTANTSANNSGVGLGIGGSYKLTDAAAVTFGLDTATFKSAQVSGTGSASLLSVGLRYKF
ncbi:MAG: outer membrane beta-barrel protein [Cytophagales bacterium]|nr:outer membrane beta-barrel protein [Cytophagales bacterium]